MRTIETPWPGRVLLLEGFDRTASADAFSDADLAAAEHFHLAKRRDQWLASRLAAKRLALQRGACGSLQDCTLERPYLLDGGRRSGWYCSVSHSGDYAAAALSRIPVGVDIEVVRDVAERASHFFLTDAEIAMMRDCELDHALLHFWCAKEAAWKQRSEEFATLKQLPLSLLSVQREGLQFDVVETVILGRLIVAVTRETADG
jgi:phosphopantetheinyl transferase